MNKTKQDKKSGAVLIIAMVVLISFTLFVAVLMQLASHNAQETENEVRRSQAFWMAQTGYEFSKNDWIYNNRSGEIYKEIVPSADGTREMAFEVEENKRVRTATGTVTVGGQDTTRKIRFLVVYGPKPNSIYSGQGPLILSGTGDNADELFGDVEIDNDNGGNGDILLLEDSSVGEPTPNLPAPYDDMGGDVTAAGSFIGNTDNVSGTIEENGTISDAPNLFDMDYPNNCDYDIAAIFTEAGVASGRLPVDHPLYNLVVKNPGTRAAENASTLGDDYYFEPVGGWNNSSGSLGADTPLNISPENTDGNPVYYVDGHVWFNSHQTYGYEIDGRAVIVSSRDIHVSDNLKYIDYEDLDEADQPLLGLVASGTYNTSGERQYGGDIYFGDPAFGTMYTVDAFMFAGNNFLYNTLANNGGQMEPDTGFEVFGNFTALNQIVVLRDWYGTTDDPKPTVYDPDLSAWVDEATGVPLTEEELNGYTFEETWYYAWDLSKINPQTKTTTVPPKRHYKMSVGYDIRMITNPLNGMPETTHNPEQYPLNLPHEGVKEWQHLDDVIDDDD